MGYESRVYIVVEWPLDQSLAWGDVLATFDLSKMGCFTYKGKMFRELFNKTRTCYFYDFEYDADASRGEKDYYVNTIMTEDRYGDEIKKADIHEVIDWMDHFLKEDDYWRAKVFRDTLVSLVKANAVCSVYHFGY